MLFLYMACKTPTETETTLPIEDFKIAPGELSKPGIDAGTIYVGEDLYTAIDGYAGEYLDQGYAAGLFQKLENTEIIVETRVMDFKTAANSSGMYESEIADYPEGAVVPNTYITSVFKAGGMFGVDVYGYHKNIYFEIKVQDGGNSISADWDMLADEVIGLYEAKAKSAE
jgi:hypothetical protein